MGKSALKNHLKEFINPGIIIMLLVIIILSVIISMLLKDKVPNFKQTYKRKFYIYIGFMFIIYALVAFLGNNKLLEDISDEFICYQIFSLILGIAHTFFYRTYFNRFDKPNEFGIELLFCLITILIASIPFIIVYTLLNGTTYLYLILTHFIVFFIPTWINSTFNYMISIPPKIYVTWELPLNENAFAPLAKEEFRDLIVLKLLVRRAEGEEYSSYRVKGPIRVDFGRLFFHFVMDYNDRRPEEPIQVEENGLSFEWVFFLRSGFLNQTKYIDPKMPLYMNGIEENSIIVCQRVIVREEESNNTDEVKDSGYEYKFDKEDKQKEIKPN